MIQKISIIGSGNVGTATAQLIASKGLSNVVLIDTLEGLSLGKALDLYQAALVEKQDTSITGTMDYSATANSDIIIITAGIAAKTGMSREDLLKTNATIVRDVVKKSSALSPNAVIIIVSNPMDAMRTWGTGLSKSNTNSN